MIDKEYEVCSLEEAEEHFKRNIEGAYSGNLGPIFVTPFI